MTSLRALFAVLAALLVTLGHAHSVSANVDPLFAEARAASDAAISKLERMRAQIDRETLSLDAKADALDYDPEAAVAYVGNDIGFLPYPGAMRGDIGVMATGSGSALDQAMLLGGLLDIMGLDVALAFGELKTADLDRLMRSTDALGVPDLAVDLAAISGISDRDDSLYEAEVQSDLDVDDTRSALMTALSKSPTSTSSKLMNAIRKDTRDHYVWVMHRDSAGQDWTHVHPAFGASKAPNVVPTRYSSVSVPEGREHSLRVTVSIEVTTKGRARMQPLVQLPYTPIAELAAQQIDLTLTPIGLDGTDVTGTQGFAYAQPMINGETPASAKAFSPRGELINASTVNSAQSAVASQSLFGDAMRDIGNRQDEGHITGLYLLTTYDGPLGRTTRKRVLRDLSHTKPGDVVTTNDITMSVVFDINIGQTNMARVTDRVIETAMTTARHAPFQMRMATTGEPIPGYSEDPDLLSRPIRPSWPAMALAHEAFTPTRFEGQAVLPVTAQVSTLIRQVRGGTELETAPELVQIMDLMFTDAVVLKNGKADPSATRALGVTRTLNESLLLRGRLKGNPLYEKSAKLEPLDSNRAVEAFAKTNALSPIVTARLLDDVEQSGRVLVATHDLDNLHWWKLDARTGEALGMGVYGGNEALVYGHIQQMAANNALSAAFAVYGIFSCTDGLMQGQKGRQLGGSGDFDSATRKYVKCLVVNAALYHAGGWIGAGATMGQSARAAFATNLLIDVVSIPLGNEITG